MSLRQTLRRLEAWKAGRPLPCMGSFPWPELPESETLVLAFVRMAGETLPWAVAVGAPNEEPQLYSVADPRKVDDVIAMLIELAPTILKHLHHPMTLTEEDQNLREKSLDEFLAQLPNRQFWLPGASHLTMMHLLDYRLSPARRADKKTLAIINPLGRAFGWLFRESKRPGQYRVMDACQRLTQVFDFPAEDLRQQHLAYLMAWLTESGDRNARRKAAAIAEDESISTTMNPDFEKEELASLVDNYNKALDSEADSETDKEQRPSSRISALIRQKVEAEVVRRWNLTVRARQFLVDDPRESNSEMGKLEKLARDEFKFQYYRHELPRNPIDDQDQPPRIGAHPETEKTAQSAAARYFTHQFSEELANAEWVHGDRELLSLALERGDAVKGLIIEVGDEGPGRTSTPVWTVLSKSAGLLRLREGSSVCVFGLRGRTGQIRTVEFDGSQRRFEIVINGWKRKRENAPAANDEEALVGSEVVLVVDSPANLSKQKAGKVWNRDTPGSWLTHSTPAPVPSPKPKVRRDLLDLVEKLGEKS